MKHITISIMLLMLSMIVSAQTFGKFIGKKIIVNSFEKAEINDNGKLITSGDKRLAKMGEFFCLTDEHHLDYGKNGVLNKYQVDINSYGDLDVTKVIKGENHKWFQIIAWSDGTLRIWSDDSYLRYCSVGNNDNNNISNDDDDDDDNDDDDATPNVDINIDDKEKKVAMDYLNQVRMNPAAFSNEIKVNLSGIKPNRPLKWDPRLAVAAQNKAADMARRNYFSHVDPDGCGMNIKIDQAGYKLNPSWIAQKSMNNFESLAQNYSASGKEAVILLINDGGANNSNAGHRIHLLGMQQFWANCTDIGIGHASSNGRHYWCFLVAKHDF